MYATSFSPALSLQLGKLACTVAQLLHGNPGSVEQRQQQVRQRSLIGNSKMLASLDLSEASADDGRRQREMVMGVAIAHVAAEKNDRMIQHRSVAVGHFRELRQELGECLCVVHLNLSERHKLALEILVMRNGVE